MGRWRAAYDSRDSNCLRTASGTRDSTEYIDVSNPAIKARFEESSLTEFPLAR